MTLDRRSFNFQGFVEGDVCDNQLVELRQYALYGGQRNTLARLFAKAFVSTQEAVGAHVLGTFRDLDDPDRFVWLRGFGDMEARGRALTDFYGGEAWQAHRDAANATMLDSDNVLLLRPSVGAAAVPRLTLADGQVLAVWIHDLASTAPSDFARFHQAEFESRIEALGVQPTFRLVTEPRPNNFPRLPVRSDSVFAWGAVFADTQALAEFEAARSHLSGWRDRAPGSLLPALMRKPERLRLAAI